MTEIERHIEEGIPFRLSKEGETSGWIFVPKQMVLKACTEGWKSQFGKTYSDIEKFNEGVKYLHNLYPVFESIPDFPPIVWAT